MNPLRQKSDGQKPNDPPRKKKLTTSDKHPRHKLWTKRSTYQDPLKRCE